MTRAVISLSGCYTKDWHSANTKVLQRSKNIANWQEITSWVNGMHVIRGFEHGSTQFRVLLQQDLGEYHG